MASGKCYKVIYFATKVWLGAFKVHERAENSLHGMQGWRQAVQGLAARTCNTENEGWEPIRVNFKSRTQFT